MQYSFNEILSYFERNISRRALLKNYWYWEIFTILIIPLGIVLLLILFFTHKISAWELLILSLLWELGILFLVYNPIMKWKAKKLATSDFKLKIKSSFFIQWGKYYNFNQYQEKLFYDYLTHLQITKGSR